MARYRIIVEHAPTGRIWYGKSSNMNLEEYEHLENFIKNDIVRQLAIGDLNYFNLEDTNGSIIHFNPFLLKECVLVIEKVSES